jgi:hypothetical protein
MTVAVLIIQWYKTVVLFVNFGILPYICGFHTAVLYQIQQLYTVEHNTLNGNNKVCIKVY